MPVLIEALSVVMRRETIARRYEGGWPGFVADAVNQTLCADSDIVRIGFMHPDDGLAFINRMNRKGFVFLDVAGDAVDIVVVDQREGPTAPCAWIEFYRQEVPGGMVSAARLAGSRDKALSCPVGWDFEHSLSKCFEFHPPATVDENLEFLRHEQGLDVFRNRLTGKEVFVGRPSMLRGKTDEPDPSSKARVARDKECAALWNEACELLDPYFRTNGIPAAEPLNFRMDSIPATEIEIASVVRAREALEHLTVLWNTSWRPWYSLGYARRLLLDRKGAYAAFARAYRMAPNEIELGRNFAAECIALGHGQEAVAVSAAMSRLAPDDAGIVANHALALLIGGDVDGAHREVQRAMGLDPEDEITRGLERVIEDVRDGTVRCPSKMWTCVPDVTFTLLREGEKLSATNAAELETNVGKKPNDLDNRLRLLSYYAGQEDSDEIQRIRSARAGHILWIIRNEPKAAVFDVATRIYAIQPMGGPLADASEFLTAKEAWQDQIASHPRDYEIKRNAAMFLEIHDPAMVETLLKSIGNDRWLGQLYAKAILGIAASDYRTSDPVLTTDERRNSDFTRHALAELESSNNAAMLGGAGLTLCRDGGLLYADGKLDWDYTALATKLFAKVERIDPSNQDAFSVVPELPRPGERPPVTIRLGGAELQKKLQKRTDPVRPLLGTPQTREPVRMNVLVGLDGNVLRAVAADGPSQLRDAATAAVKNWIFAPTSIDGKPVYVLSFIDLQF